MAPWPVRERFHVGVDLSTRPIHFDALPTELAIQNPVGCIQGIGRRLGVDVDVPTPFRDVDGRTPFRGVDAPSLGRGVGAPILWERRMWGRRRQGVL